MMNDFFFFLGRSMSILWLCQKIFIYLFILFWVKCVNIMIVQYIYILYIFFFLFWLKGCQSVLLLNTFFISMSNAIFYIMIIKHSNPLSKHCSSSQTYLFPCSLLMKAKEQCVCSECNPWSVSLCRWMLFRQHQCVSSTPCNDCSRSLGSHSLTHGTLTTHLYLPTLGGSVEKQSWRLNILSEGEGGKVKRAVHAGDSRGAQRWRLRFRPWGSPFKQRFESEARQHRESSLWLVLWAREHRERERKIEGLGGMAFHMKHFVFS